MATATDQETEAFPFGLDTVQTGDRFHLDHDGGQVVIVVTDFNVAGLDGVWGIAADGRANWFGHWGRIIFYRPIRIGEMTEATFNQTGSRVSRLEVVPTKLVRYRDNEREELLG